jgi:hypothetical protein
MDTVKSAATSAKDFIADKTSGITDKIPNLGITDKISNLAGSSKDMLPSMDTVKQTAQ